MAAPVADPAKEITRSSGRKKERRRAVPLEPEFRKFSVTGANIEVRKKSGSDQLVVHGEPIVYDTRYSVYDVFGEFQEEIRAGALTDILDTCDCRLLLNHDGLAIARNKAGTLDLKDTPSGLTFEARLDPRQQLANDFTIAVERGDMDEMSVGMVVGKDSWSEDRAGENDIEVREITRLADLVDVSGVTYAASPTTSIAKRALAQAPIESRARLRRLEVALRNGEAAPEDILEALVALRGGKVLSEASTAQVKTAANALNALLESAGVDPREAEEEIERREDEDDETEIPEGEELPEDDEEEPPAEVGEQEEGEPVKERSSYAFALELRKRRRA